MDQTSQTQTEKRVPRAVVAQTPGNEERRLAAVKRTGLMDAKNLDRFDIYTRLFRHIAGVPVSYTGLLDETRQYFLSDNFTGCLLGATEVARNETLCQHALLSPKPLIVSDMRVHPTFENHPLIVGDPFWVFWAGFPLVTAEGYILGTLCAVDFEPRTLNEEQIDLLSGVAADLTMSIQLQTDQQEMIADQAVKVLASLSKEGVTSLGDATNFLRLCAGKPLSTADKQALAEIGLVEEVGGLYDLSAKGRRIKSEQGLGPASYKVSASPISDAKLLETMLDSLDF